jgi:hypothetical protein
MCRHIHHVKNAYKRFASTVHLVGPSLIVCQMKHDAVHIKITKEENRD